MEASKLDTEDVVAGDDAPELHEEVMIRIKHFFSHLQADGTAVNPLLLLRVMTCLVPACSCLKLSAHTRYVRIPFLCWTTSTRTDGLGGDYGFGEKTTALVAFHRDHEMVVV